MGLSFPLPSGLKHILRSGGSIGPVIQGEFNPNSISGMVRYFDETTHVKTGASLTQWTDKLGSGGNAAQGTATNQPQVNSTKNGLDIVSFSTNDYLSLTISESSPITLFIIAKYNSAAGQYLCDGADINNRLAVFLTDAGKTGAVVTTTAFGGVDSGDTNWHIHTLTADGVSTEYQIDDGTPITASAGALNLANMVIGARQNLINFLDGDEAEIWMYNRALAAGEKTQLKTFGNDKWAI